jgi:hypothetical protein
MQSSNFGRWNAGFLAPDGNALASMISEASSVTMLDCLFSLRIQRKGDCPAFSGSLTSL